MGIASTGGGRRDEEAQLDVDPAQQAAEPSTKGKGLAAAAACYGALNLVSGVTIVVANKLVLYTYAFGFPVTLTLLHQLFIASGMQAAARLGMYRPQPVPPAHSLPMAGCLLASIVLGNMSLKMNSFGFYQINKLLIVPLVIVFDYLLYRRTVDRSTLLAVATTVFGAGLASLHDAQVWARPAGAAVALISTGASALYQVWVGGKQKDLGLDGMQLLGALAPVSAGMLLLLAPAVEPLGLLSPGPTTVLGHVWTAGGVAALLGSCVLGLAVTLSTFLLIGATSALTFNVVGLVKMLLTLTAGVVVFQEQMGLPKLGGIVVAFTGTVWYTHHKLALSQQQQAP